MSRADSGRRRFLAALAAAVAPLSAGCSGDDGTDTTDATATPTRTATPTPTPSRTASPTDTETTLAERKRRARTLTERLVAREYAAVLEAFADAGNFSVARLRQAWVLHTAGKGEFRRIASVARTTVGDETAVEVTAAFEAGRTRALWFFSGADVAGLRFRQVEAEYEPPAYADRTAFEERSLALSTPACELGATLSLPTGDGSVPGVVLVHGTGPQDRELSVGPNRPFRDLAWGLASRGVAVLRYDKRTFACDVARRERLTIDDVTTDDAVTAVERLRARERVDRVAVVGHSQGGMMAPRIVRRSDAAAMALLSAPAGPLWELVPEQVRHIASIDGEVTEREADRIDAAETAARRITEGEFDPGETLLGASGRYWESLRSYDQTAVAADLDVSAFVGHGGRDYQVPPSAVEEWRASIGDRGLYREYPALNHILVPGVGPSSPYNYANPGNVDRTVVEDLAAWVDGS